MNTSSSSTPTAQSQRAEGLIDRVKDRAAAQLSTQKDKATDGLGSVAQMVRQGTQQLRDQQHETLADYVGRAADQIDRLSQQLRDRDIGELVETAQNAARRRPAVFIGSAFALGVIGARFFKSSSTDADQYGPSSHRSTSYRQSSGNVYGSGTANTTYGSTAGSKVGASATTSESASASGNSMRSAGGTSEATPGSTAATGAPGSRRGTGGTTGRS